MIKYLDLFESTEKEYSFSSNMISLYEKYLQNDTIPLDKKKKSQKFYIKQLTIKFHCQMIM